MASRAGKTGKRVVVEEDYDDDTGAEEIDPCDIVLGQLVGSGQTAEVFLGSWKDRVVAIKQVNCTRMTPTEKMAFCREVSILEKVNHANLVRLFGYCISSDPCQVVCDYCEGGTLFEMLHNRTEVEISLVQRVKMCTDTARGMDYLHRFSPQIIHRDLKSLNLLLCKRLAGLRDTPVVKVADFGLARVLPGDRADLLTSCVGTAHWMAPEMFSSKNYNAKVDVYSFAIVVWEVIHRVPPWGGTAGRDIERLVRKGVRPSLDDVPDGIPAALLRVMKASWAAIPDRRPSFDVVVQELSAIEVAGGFAAAAAAGRACLDAHHSASGYLSKTRAIGECTLRAVSL